MQQYKYYVNKYGISMRYMGIVWQDDQISMIALVGQPGAQ